MTPKDKAAEIYWQMARNQVWGSQEMSTQPQRSRAKVCAAIAARLVLQHGEMVDDDATVEYWRRVIAEIDAM